MIRFIIDVHCSKNARVRNKTVEKGRRKAPLLFITLYTIWAKPNHFTPAVTMETGSLPLLGVKRHCDRRPSLTRSAVCVVTSLVFNCKLANKHRLSRSVLSSSRGVRRVTDSGNGNREIYFVGPGLKRHTGPLYKRL